MSGNAYGPTFVQAVWNTYVEILPRALLALLQARRLLVWKNLPILSIDPVCTNGDGREWERWVLEAPAAAAAGLKIGHWRYGIPCLGQAPPGNRSRMACWTFIETFQRLPSPGPAGFPG